jgi:hypothetical protein
MQIALTGYIAAYSLIPDATFAAWVESRMTSAQGSQFYSEWWQLWRSLGESNSCFRRERATS